MSPPAGFTRRFRVEHGDVTASQLRQAAKAFNFGFAMYASRSVAEHAAVLNGNRVHNDLERGYRGFTSQPWPAHLWTTPGGEK